LIVENSETEEAAVQEVVEQLHKAATARKCWSCGCLHGGLTSIGRAFPEGKRPPALDAALDAAREHLVELRYDCLGCEICYPAVAINALGRLGGAEAIETEVCPTAVAEVRNGWPPLPGTYTVLRYAAPVAVCTLTDEKLLAAITEKKDPSVAIVGTLQTENLGIERLIQNVLANPNIRSLVVCGADSRQAVGHLPGQSLLALARSGVDEGMRIIGAAGKRPVLRNLSREAVERFRRTVEAVDLIGQDGLPAVRAAVQDCTTRNPGPAEPFAHDRIVTPLQGYLPERMVPDPAGYFVIYVDRAGRRLSLEHYSNAGVLDNIIEGRSAPELYIPAVEQGFVSRLDHAAYLGRELARAEQALASGEPFIQDAAPECPPPPPVPAACGCEDRGT
jgi:tetrahydromethanopterin S-methyltransferase subunit A